MNKNQRQHLLIKRVAVAPWEYTPEKLAQEFDVSLSSIGRDIRELEFHGFVFDQNRRGYLFLRQPGWPNLENIKNAAIRQSEILRFLHGRHQGTPVQEVIRRFGADREISAKTLKRDLRELVKNNFIDCHEGKVILNAGQVLPPLSLEEDEKKLLEEALFLQREMSTRKDEVRSIAAKLKVTFALAQEKREIVVVHGRKPTANLRTGHYCDLLEEYAQAREKILILYRKEGQPAYEIRLNPLGLIYYWVLDNWYLIAQEDKPPYAVKNYAVDRILAVEAAGASFTVPEGFELEEWSQYAWGVFHQGNPVKVVLRFYNDYATFQRVYEELARRKSCTLREENDTLIVEDFVDGYGEIAVWLRGFGPAVKVLEPIELREMVTGDLEQMLQNYGGNPRCRN